MTSKAIIDYIKKISNNQNKNTAKEYSSRLQQFEQFCNENYQFNLDELLINKMFQVNVYDLLSSYVSYLVSRNSISNLTIKQRVITARNFLESYDIEISPRKFKLNVNLPKAVRRNKEPLEKEDIVKILENCTNFKLKTFLICLAATGIRAGEACSIRVMDINFEKSRVKIRGEFTKTKEDRYVYLTDELIQQLRAYFDYKYRKRIKYYPASENKKPLIFTPEKKDTDLVFASYFNIGEKQDVYSIYIIMLTAFGKTLDRLKVGYEDATKRRHKITLHSFRRFVKSTISDLGYSDYSEWFIGHAGSTYYRKSDKEKFALFKKIEPYLTYLDQSNLQLRQADTQSKLEIIEREYRELKDNMNKIMEMIQQNPTLAQVKPEVLTKKIH